MLQRAYTLVEFKSIDEDKRIIEGIASTVTADRVGDIVEPKGAVFKLPLPFMWQHGTDPFVGKTPVGHLIAATPTDTGIPVRVQMERSDTPGRLKDILDFAWEAVKKKLVRGMSIGFNAIEAADIKGSFGTRFTKWEWLELSAVTIAANADASIQTIKSLSSSASHLAASGEGREHHTPGASGTPVVKLLPSRREQHMKTLAEQITGFENTRAAKHARLEEIQTKSADEGRTKDEAEREEFGTLKSEIKSIDAEIQDLREMQEMQKQKAAPVTGGDPMAAHVSRGGGQQTVTVKSNLPPGIEFAMAMVCKAQALNYGGYAVDYAKQLFPDRDRVAAFLKATIPAATTTGVTWGAPLVDPTNLAGEFIEFLRPETIIGKFGMNGIPALRRVPFNVRMNGQTSGGDAYWVGEGAPKPLTKFDFNATTLTITKIASISVLTDELIRLATPNALDLVRNGLRDANVERADIDFIDPTQAAVSGVSPASITNGLTPLVPSGTSADNARADYARIVKSYLDSNNRPRGLVIIMPDALALSLSVMVNSLGQREFPDLTMEGGRLLGVPVITSQYAANTSGAGNLVIGVNAPDVFLADDGGVDIAMSREASLQMLDNPTNSSATGTATSMVSMFQTNSVAVRAERHINWAKRRAGAAVYMDDVNWGAIGSPA